MSRSKNVVQHWAPWIAVLGILLMLATGDSLPLAVVGVGLLAVVAVFG
jgi:hypothetical protein